MSLYEEQLEAKIKRQKSEITRLLKENAELKSAREEGQQEAWKLAKDIVISENDGGYSMDELNEIFDFPYLSKIFNFTYSEAAAKVAEWERKKEEICVGDVVRFKENHRIEFCVTEILDDSFLYGISAEGGVYSNKDIKLFEKTGRHINVASMLAQIGSESE